MQKTTPSLRGSKLRVKSQDHPKDLGVKIGMEQSSASGRMNHYEKGRHVPDIGTLERMAEELDVPLNYFFCRSELSAELACAIDKMSDEEKVVLLETQRARSNT